jgi:hypothetical protein
MSSWEAVVQHSGGVYFSRPGTEWVREGKVDFFEVREAVGAGVKAYKHFIS